MRASSRTTKVRTKVLAAFVSMAMACGMVAALPSLSTALSLNSDSVTAYADEGNEIEFVQPQPATVNVGGQVDLSKWLAPAPNGNHYDFKVTSGTNYGQVNKHSGMFTARSIGECTVTVYLVQGPAPTQNPNNPDGTVLDEAPLRVEVNPAAGYGYQGNSLAIRLANQPVASVTSDASGYTNQLGTVKAESDGSVLFEIQMTNGFANYNTALAYAGYNEGNIVLKNGVGVNLAYLNKDNTGMVTIDRVDNSTKTIWVKVSSINSGQTYTLSFQPSLRANNAKLTLGTTVNFTFAK